MRSGQGSVARRRPRELEQEFLFGVVRRLFERTVHDLPAADREPLLGGAASLAAPVLGLAAPASTPPADAFGVLRGLHWLCFNLAERAPLMIVVDDLHWAAEVRATRMATGGNPFLTVTLAAAIARREASDLGPTDHVVVDAARTIAGVVAGRLGRLPPAAAALARAVAVFGAGTPHRLALALAALGDADAPLVHDALATDEILQAWPALEFVHPLMATELKPLRSIHRIEPAYRVRAIGAS